jgi:hypothetical protein
MAVATDSLSLKSNEKDCNKDSLIIWSSKTIKNKSGNFLLSKDVITKISEDSTSISVIWLYDINNPKLFEDKYVKYCIDLIKEKIKIPKDYRLRFHYMLNAYCSGDLELPIESNSEIQNLSIIDNITFTRYDFDLIRGRIDSGIKYFKNSSKKVTDTIYIQY